MRKTIRVLGVALAAAFGALTVATAAQATGPHAPVPCASGLHGTTAGITLQGAATASLTGDGVKLTTGLASDDDQASYAYTLPTAIDGDALTAASYTTTKLDEAGPGVNDAALPSFHIYVSVGGQPGVLIYEPYWQLTGNPPRGVEHTWNVLAGKLWTSSTTINGLTKTAGGPPEKTFAQVNADNPDLIVTGYGFGLGTYNRGVVALLNDLKLVGGHSCTQQSWSTRWAPTPSGSTSATPTATPTATSTASPAPSVSPTKTVTTSPAPSVSPTTIPAVPAGEVPGGGGVGGAATQSAERLPVTGSRISGLLWMGGGLVLIGAVVLLAVAASSRRKPIPAC